MFDVLRYIVTTLFDGFADLRFAVKSGFQQQEKHMAEIDDRISALQSDVGRLTDVAQSAETLLNGLQGMIADGVAHALAAGATQEQLAALQSIDTALQSTASGLAKAVATANPAPADNNPATTTPPSTSSADGSPFTPAAAPGA